MAKFMFVHLGLARGEASSCRMDGSSVVIVDSIHSLDPGPLLLDDVATDDPWVAVRPNGPTDVSVVQARRHPGSLAAHNTNHASHLKHMKVNISCNISSRVPSFKFSNQFPGRLDC